MDLCARILEAFHHGTVSPAEVCAELTSKMHDELKGTLHLTDGPSLIVPREHHERVIRATWPVLVKYCLERSARHGHRTFAQEMHDAMGNYYLTHP